VELGRRLDGRALYGLTTPLITTASGAKMGKTASGAVWLNAERRSPYEYWQFWRNVEDADIGRFLRLFTELPMDEIARLERLEGAERNESKKVLATEATALAHGRAAAEAAAETARRTFEEGASGEALPKIAIGRAELDRGIPAFELLHRAGLAASKGEARRLIKAGGAKLNDAAIDDEMRPVTSADLDGQGLIKLSVGKKRHALVEAG
jgi:tyrosyl-tRNA synthetase